MIKVRVKVSGVKRAVKLLGAIPPRADRLMRGLVQHVARDTLNEVAAGAPDGIEGYPELLDLYSLPVTDGVAVGIFPPPWAFSQMLRGNDASRTLLWIKPTMARGEAVSAAAVALSRYNPWTMDTLPWVPGKRQAQIVAQQVRVREVLEVKRDRERDYGTAVAAIQAAGEQPRSLAEVELGRRVTRDLMFEVARAEFGYHGQGQAHWRPALRNVPRSVRKRGAELFRWLVSDESEYNSGVETKPGRRSDLKFVQKFQEMVR